jgi:hypothetical protein
MHNPVTDLLFCGSPVKVYTIPGGRGETVMQGLDSVSQTIAHEVLEYAYAICKALRGLLVH